MNNPTLWHTPTTDQVLAGLDAGTSGLNVEEALRRQDEQGPNELPRAQGSTPWSILLAQFKYVLITILLIAATLSAFLGEVVESIVIAVIVRFAIRLRSDRQSLLHKPFANKWLNLAIPWELVMLSLVVYVPVLQQAFGTYNLPVGDWLIVTFLALTVIPVLELTKWLTRKKVPLAQVGQLTFSSG
jgi:magnesium-transporting ATPase (P-type)